MKKIISFILLVIFVNSDIALGQTTQTITIQEAIQIALENNFALKQAENNLYLSEERIKNEMADFLPSVSGRLNGSQNTGQQFVADRLANNLNPFVSITSKSFSGSIGGDITIFNGFENINSLRASKATKTSREEDLLRQKETIIFQTASAYLQVLLDQQLLDIRQENLMTSERVLEQTRAQVEVGSRPTVDLYQQESTVANNELLVTQQENAFMLDKLSLVRRLQIDPLGDYEFVVPEFDEDMVSEKGMSLDLRDLVNQALSSRSDIKSAQSNIESLQLQYSISKFALLPTISANFGLSSRYSDQFSFAGEIVSFNDQFLDQQVNKSLGFSVNVPIFSNWNRMFNIQSSRIQLKNARLDLENTELQVIQEVTQAYNDYGSFIKQYESAQKSLRANEKAFETQQERYNVGASTLIELSQAQAQYVQAQSESTQALYQLIFQEKLLDFFLGKLSGEEVEF